MSIKEILSSPDLNKVYTISGWIRFFRNNQFLIINDGSTLNNLQAVVDGELVDERELKELHVGTAVEVSGKLVESKGGGQQVELLADKVKVLGYSNHEKYPIQPKKHSLEFLREKAHLRFRTNTFSAVFRIRHAMTFAVHQFFNERGFYNIHTPIITGSDCEGAGEMFTVTGFDLDKLAKDENGKVDYSKDFFGKHTNLTVSGQLNGEMAAMALGKIYTFGPTFRAENSNTSRHLAEFWMIEPEVAFNLLEDNIALAQDFVKFLLNYALEHCAEDLAFLEDRLLKEEASKPANERSGMALREKLQHVIDEDFQVITYTEAIDILKQSKPNKKKKFEYLVNEWGIDLQSEHEKYLVEKHFKKPVVVTDYPAKIKAFYMKLSDDAKTVRAMDVLVPGIGELIGGSQREDDLNKLIQRASEVGIAEEELDWYLDSRRFGSAPHSGFGLGFERLLLFVTGMTNIRDVIPFPRAPKQAQF
jgi:asparaginyl-tRNA synthetase